MGQRDAAGRSQRRIGRQRAAPAGGRRHRGCRTSTAASSAPAAARVRTSGHRRQRDRDSSAPASAAAPAAGAVRTTVTLTGRRSHGPAGRPRGPAGRDTAHAPVDPRRQHARSRSASGPAGRSRPGVPGPASNSSTSRFADFATQLSSTRPDSSTRSPCRAVPGQPRTRGSVSTDRTQRAGHIGRDVGAPRPALTGLRVGVHPSSVTARGPRGPDTAAPPAARQWAGAVLARAGRCWGAAWWALAALRRRAAGAASACGARCGWRWSRAGRPGAAARAGPPGPAPDRRPAWTAALTVAIAAGHGMWAAATHAEQVVLRRDPGLLRAVRPVDRHPPSPPDRRPHGGVRRCPALRDPMFTVASPAFFQIPGPAERAGGDPHGSPRRSCRSSCSARRRCTRWASGSPGWTGLFVVPAVVGRGSACSPPAACRPGWSGPRSAPLAAAALALTQPVLHAARGPPTPSRRRCSGRRGRVPAGRCASARADGRRSTRSRDREDGRSAGAVERPATGPRRGVRIARRRWPADRPGGRAARGRPAAPGGRGAGCCAGIPRGARWPRGRSRRWHSRRCPRSCCPAVLGQVAGSLLPLLALGVVLGLGSLAVVRRARRDPPPPRRPVAARWWARAPAAGDVSACSRRRAAGQPAVVADGPAEPADPGSKVVAGLQRRQGLPVDGGRTYAEHSVQWVAWYTGPIALIVAWVVLAALAGHRASLVAGRRAGAVLARPDVRRPRLDGAHPVPARDHARTIPWADRRLVPVVLPTVMRRRDRRRRLADPRGRPPVACAAQARMAPSPRRASGPRPGRSGRSATAASPPPAPNSASRQRPGGLRRAASWRRRRRRGHPGPQRVASAGPRGLRPCRPAPSRGHPTCCRTPSLGWCGGSGRRVAGRCCSPRTPQPP